MDEKIKAGDGQISAEDLFKRLKKLEESTGVSGDQAKEMVTELINVLRGHKLTYHQAYRILEITSDTLRTMSQLLSI